MPRQGVGSRISRSTTGRLPQYTLRRCMQRPQPSQCERKRPLCCARRLSCNVAGATSLAVSEVDLKETLELLAERLRLPTGAPCLPAARKT